MKLHFCRWQVRTPAIYAEAWRYGVSIYLGPIHIMFWRKYDS